jgi:DNA-binding MarR family transcriptional regulator
MNNNSMQEIPDYQVRQFRELVDRLYQCCVERMEFQSEKFGLPAAELRCLTLFDGERYLTPGGIARKMNVAKSRVSKIVSGLVEKGLVRRTKDPEDSRVTLLGLTPEGRSRLAEISDFASRVHAEVLASMPDERRLEIMNSLDALKSSMEATKDLME